MGWLEKGVIFYFFLALAIACWQPTVVFDSNSPTDATLLSWFNVVLDSNNQTVYNTSRYAFTGNAGGSAGNMTVTAPVPTGTNILTLIDPIYQIFSWIPTLVKIMFGPIILLTKPEFAGMPGIVYMIIGLPAILLFLVGLIYFLRGGT
jgi:hypothetical protein